MTCVFRSVPQFVSSLLPQLQLKILQSYYPWKLLCTALLWGKECHFSKNVKLFKKRLLRGKYETIKRSRYWVRQVICHPCYPYFYKVYMLQTYKNPKAKYVWCASILLWKEFKVLSSRQQIKWEFTYFLSSLLLSSMLLTDNRRNDY